MDIKDQIRLHRQRKEIREKVIFKYIAASLLKDNVINSEEFQIISQQLTKQAQMDMLMELLLRKNGNAFNSFVAALEEDYDWLAHNLCNQSVSDLDVQAFRQDLNQEDITDGQNENYISSALNKEISIDMINILKKNARLIRRWTALAYRLGLDRQAQSIKVQNNMNCEDLDQCLFHLIREWASVKPRDATLGNLIRALRAEEFNDVAVQLENQFC